MSHSSGDPLASAGGGKQPAWSEFRAALESEGFRPTKTLGQNFLVDPSAARSIARDARVGRADWVLEVGAGCGFLSIHLADLGVALLAVEIDPRLAGVATRFLSARTNVRWLVSDVLDGKHALSARVRAELPGVGDWHVVSNLPYSIAAPLLVLLSRLPNPPRTMGVLVQEEVAERIAAAPGESRWGALSARLALLYEHRLGRRVGAQLVWPRPRVASRVVHLTHQPVTHEPGGEHGPEVLAAVDRLIDGLFQRRRKQLATALAALLGGREEAQEMLAFAGVDPRSRPQELTPIQLLSLARFPRWSERSATTPRHSQV